MTTVGGSIEEITLDGRIFAVAADVESQRKLGGFENEVMSNGDGGARIIKTRVPLQIDGLQVECDDARDDHQFLQELSDRSDFFVILITYASGISFQGSAIITGELQVSNQSSSAAVTLSGPGTLTRQ